MKPKTLKFRVTRPLVLSLALLAAPAVQAAGVSTLEPRLSTVKPTNPELDSDTQVERLVVKFHEGTRVRLRGGLMRAMAAERSQAESAHMQSRGLNDEKLLADLHSAHQVLERAPRMGPAGRLFRQDELTLAERKRAAEERSGRQMADLDLYFEVPLLPGARAGDVEALLAQLNTLESVEIAYAEPLPEPATVGVDTQPTVSPYESRQGYLDAAPGGIDARYAWTVAGGKGTGVKIVDVEGAWNGTHEDLPSFFHVGGVPFTDSGWRNHGTAVLGELVGQPNASGVTGIVHEAQAGIEGVATQSTASAITNAAIAAGPGGIVLVELHAKGPRATPQCTCNVSQCNYIAMEYWQANFDAIALATANGVHVVEAAGNGGTNLDSRRYRGAFDRTVRDSGAILVGASTATTRAPMCWTNSGGRVDLHGWGESVVTLGYGDLSASGENQWYTARFGGTSSAAPMVVGSVASLQGAAHAAGLGLLDPRAVRELLMSTGTPQASSPQQIGPLPNLRDALPRLLAR